MIDKFFEKIFHFILKITKLCYLVRQVLISEKMKIMLTY